MHRSPNHPLLRPVLLLLAAGALGPLVASSLSCTAIGYSIGNSISKRQPPRMIPAGRALTIGAGTPMAIALEDSGTVRGFYLGRAQLDEATYAARVDAWRARVPDAPALGEPVELVRNDGRGEPATFEGFAYRSVVVRRDGRAKRESIPFSKLAGLGRSAGRMWTRAELAAQDAAGSLPSREALLVGLGLPFDWRGRKQWDGPGIQGGSPPAFPDTAVVAVDQVRLLEVPGSSSARTICTLVGFAVDAGIVAVVAAAASFRGPFDSASGCSSGMGSMAARFAPVPTTHDFDTLAGAFVPAGVPVRPDGPPLAPAP